MQLNSSPLKRFVSCPPDLTHQHEQKAISYTSDLAGLGGLSGGERERETERGENPHQV